MSTYRFASQARYERTLAELGALWDGSLSMFDLSEGAAILADDAGLNGPTDR